MQAWRDMSIDGQVSMLRPLSHVRGPMMMMRPARVAAIRMEPSDPTVCLTLCDLSIELDQRLEAVVGQPGLGEDETVLSIDVFPLNVAEDGLLCVVLEDACLEEDAVGCPGLYLELRDAERVVLAEQVAERLAEILPRRGHGAAVWYDAMRPSASADVDVGKTVGEEREVREGQSMKAMQCVRTGTISGGMCGCSENWFPLHAATASPPLSSTRPVLSRPVLPRPMEQGRGTRGIGLEHPDTRGWHSRLHVHPMHACGRDSRSHCDVVLRVLGVDGYMQ